jgi:hypothetical protein
VKRQRPPPTTTISSRLILEGFSFADDITSP